jgi:glucose-6-phosphate 1-dehydrogenase
MMDEQNRSVSFVIVGASGDLARRKIVPALFALFCAGRLPQDFLLFGFGRSAFTDEAYRECLREHLTCRMTTVEACSRQVDAFLARCHYHAGAYDAVDAYLDLFQRLQALELRALTNRVFYMAIPPDVFLDVARALGASGLIVCGASPVWSRVVVEKPFGWDRASSDRLVAQMSHVFTESATYRIDHYLGKELVQNLMVLRFANRVFEPVWSRAHIQAVRIIWQEDASLAGRAGYFDRAGIVRDVVQNHLLQILALIAMEPPARLDGHAVRDAKVAVLRRVAAPRLQDVVMGQYTADVLAGVAMPAYRDEPGVPAQSRTPTYASLRLSIDTPRWRGVPFWIEAGKGMSERKSEVRLQFHPARHNLFHTDERAFPPNELVLRIQPDEAIRLRVMGKTPGLKLEIAPTELNLLYRERYGGELPDAYELLLLDVLAGERGLFIRDDELAAAWDIVTPLLQAWDAAADDPVPYAFGSAGPVADPRGAAPSRQ